MTLYSNTSPSSGLSEAGSPVPLFDNDGTLLNACFFNGNSGLGTTSVSHNLLQLAPIFIPQACTLDALLCEVTSTVSGATLRMGIYDNVNGTPTNLVAESTELSAASPAVVESAALSTSLSVGWYWIGLTCDENSGSVICRHTGTSQSPQWASISGSNIVVRNIFEKSAVDPASSLPDPITSPTATMDAAYPAVFMKLSL